MADLSNSRIADTFKDLLQVSNSNSGVDTTLRAISDGEGTDSALKISTTAISVDNIQLDGNTVTSTDTDGNLNLEANGTGKVTVTTGNELNIVDAGGLYLAGNSVTATAAQLNVTANITTAAQTVLDDTTVSAMVDTLGGASATGSGGLVRATSPTLVTPLLGTPTSGNLANCTFPTLNQNTTGTAAIATTATCTATGTAASFYIPFVSAATTADYGLGIDAGISYNPSTNVLTAASFTGDVTGNCTGSSGSCTGNSATVTNGVYTTDTYNGTGNIVKTTSASLTTPALGTPSAGVLTSCTGYTEANVVFTDITTNDSSTTKHGFLKKLDNSATSFMNGQGDWAIPAGMAAATQAEQETGSSTTVYTSPGRQHFHHGHPKCWAEIIYTTGTPAANTSYNVNSLTDNGVGSIQVVPTVSIPAGSCLVSARATATDLAHFAIRNQGTDYLLLISNSAGAAADVDCQMASWGDLV